MGQKQKILIVDDDLHIAELISLYVMKEGYEAAEVYDGREALQEACQKKGVEFYYPSPVYCTDNAAMIGVAGYYDYLAGKRDGLDLNAVPNLRLGER